MPGHEQGNDFKSLQNIYRAEEYRVLILAVIHSAANLAEIEPKPWEASS